MPFQPRAVNRRFSFTVPQLVAAGLALMVMSGGGVWVLQHGGRATTRRRLRPPAPMPAWRRPRSPTLHTWDKDSVRGVARHQSRTRVSIRPGAAGLSISASGTTGPQGSVDYDITAPAWMPIKVEGTYNFITMDGVQGEVFANTVRGDIVIKGGSGTITAKSVEGEIQVESARGKVNVSSVNDRIRITDSSGEITAESINGGISMIGIDAKSVEASTVNGTIVYEGKLADGGRYSFATHNGDVSLGVPENANATFTIRTYQGTFSTDLPLAGVSRADIQRSRRVVTTLGNGSADVSLETFGGTIRVRRGTTARPRGRQQD